MTWKELFDEYLYFRKEWHRGRVLVQLDTILGDLPDVPVDDILSEDVYKVQKFQRRKLHCAFMNATMVSAIDAPVEFEVSIGEYTGHSTWGHAVPTNMLSTFCRAVHDTLMLLQKNPIFAFNNTCKTLL